MRIIVAVLVCVAVDVASAAVLTFESDVRPILKRHCFQCHGERGTAEGNLDLRLRRFAVNGGDSGAAVEPGNADGSLLIKRVSLGEMPPDEDKKLSAMEIDTLRRWIREGASTAGDEPASLDTEQYFTDREKNWWAFRPIRRHALPTVASEIATPIDAFLLAKLAAAEKPASNQPFTFAPVADRTTLIRRLYLNLLGVPPHPDEVAQFVDDSQPDAWNRLVDRVLTSPRYGERWGRHWLDAAGYADSEGYTDEDRVREHAWRYRDYVIRAFNEDKPYSTFVTEQLAGDELVGWPGAALDAATVESLTATGFLRMAPDGTGSGGIDQNLARNQVLADTMQIVGTALLGMTIHCSQCHDHRYDPIPQRDYYQLRAVFEPALNWKDWRPPAGRLVSLSTEADKQRRAAIETKAKQVDAERKERVAFYIAKTLEHELLMVDDELQKPLREAFQAIPADRTDDQKKLLEGHVNIANIREGSLYLYDRRRDARAKDLDMRREERLARHLQRIKTAELATLEAETREQVLAAFATDAGQRTEGQQQLVAAHPSVGVTAATLAECDRQAAADLKRYETAAAEIREYRIRTILQQYADKAKAIRETIPQEQFVRVLSERPKVAPATFVFHRGDHQQPKEKVEPRGLSVLGGAGLAPTESKTAGTTGRRLQLARHLTSGKHPLVARTFVNRVWASHFGRGIVSTTGDLGYLGDRPSHPKLLDWLAAEFVESGWSVKHLHRLILTSRVYQQSAAGSPELTAADPENRLLGRWPLRRLESETLRDAILHVAGKLSTKMYGESVPVMEDEVGQIVLGKENLDGERKPTNPIPLLEEEFRRSVYIQVRRSRPFGVLESFDLPELAPNCTQRASSNVAPQSLMLMNSDFIVKMSTFMAEQLIRERPEQADEQLRWGWQLAFGQAADEHQVARARSFVKTQTAAFRQNGVKEGDLHRSALATYCQALLGSSRFLYIE